MHNNDRLVRCHHYSGTPRPRAAPSPSHSWYDPAYLNLSPQHFPWNTIKYLQFWQISRRIFLSAWAALQILLNILSAVPGIFAKSAASSGKAAGKPAGLAKLSNISPVYLLPGTGYWQLKSNPKSEEWMNNSMNEKARVFVQGSGWSRFVLRLFWTKCQSAANIS